MNFKLITLLVFLAFEPDKSLQQDPELRIIPERAGTNEKVEITCRNNLPGSGAVYFTITRRNNLEDPGVQIVRLDVKCSDGAQLQKKVMPGFAGNIGFSGCTSISITDVVATPGITGKYQCSLQHIMADFSQVSATSQPVQLTVGDPTPLVSVKLTNAATGELVPPNGEVAAGTNVSLTCETAAANPAPDFTVAILPGGARLSAVKPGGDKDSRVLAYVLVPRQPRIAFQCKAFNGFGAEQQAEVAVNVAYEAVQVWTPTEMTFQTADEVKICSAANNPPKRLAIAGLDASLLQTGYPRYEETDGESRAYVKLAEGARSLLELKYTCTIGSLDTPATVKLQAPSSAMMTAGIAVAVGAALVIAVGVVVAVIMKKRKSSDKSSNGDNTRYGKVNQNDADLHDAHPTTKSIRVEDSKAGEYFEA